MRTEQELLRQTEIFREIPDEHLARLATRAQHRIYEPHDVIFAQGDEGDALYVVQTGEVKLTVVSPAKKDITLALLGEGDAFGDLALFDGVERSATAQATEPTRCMILKRGDFLQVIESEPAAVRAILRTMAGIIRRTNDRLTEMAGVNVNRRMAKTLLELAERHGRPGAEGGIVIDKVVTEEDLASMVGLLSIEVARLLRDYQYEDIVRVDHGNIYIRRPEVLQRWLDRT